MMLLLKKHLLLFNLVLICTSMNASFHMPIVLVTDPADEVVIKLGTAHFESSFNRAAYAVLLLSSPFLCRGFKERSVLLTTLSSCFACRELCYQFMKDDLQSRFANMLSLRVICNGQLQDRYTLDQKTELLLLAHNSIRNGQNEGALLGALTGAVGSLFIYCASK